jgi:hypothetical protein
VSLRKSKKREILDLKRHRHMGVVNENTGGPIMTPKMTMTQ